MILLLALLALPQESWEYRHGEKAFVNSRTDEKKSPEEFFAYGEKLFNQQDFARAAAAFTTLSESLPSAEPANAALREKALFAVGRCAHSAGDYSGAYSAFENFLVRAPDSDLSNGVFGAKYFLLDSALKLAQVGQKERILGVPLYTSSRAGVELLKKSLLRFSREPFTDNFYLALGEWLITEGRLDDAETEFKFILTPGQYDKTDSAPRAQLRLAEIALKRFDGINYDVKMLADAKREYAKFLSAWSRAKGDAKALAELDLTDESLQKMLDLAAEGIARINEKLAEKDWTTANYYLNKGKPSAAKVYLSSIVNNYAKTTWATKAAALLKDLK